MELTPSINEKTIGKPPIFDDEYYYNIVRKNIRYYRKAKKLTQQQLAEMTDISREYICDVENESRNKHITIATLGRIATALQIPLSDFFMKIQ